MFRKIAECIDNDSYTNSLSIQNNYTSKLRNPFVPGSNMLNSYKASNSPNVLTSQQSSNNIIYTVQNNGQNLQNEKLQKNINIHENENRNKNEHEIKNINQKNENVNLNLNKNINKISKNKFQEIINRDRDVLSLALSDESSKINNVNKINTPTLENKYNQLSSKQIDRNILLNGDITKNYILNENKQQSYNPPKYYSGIGNLPRNFIMGDMGKLHDYNFCLDLNDTDSGPYELSSIQNLFLLEGGSENGFKFPQKHNKLFWDCMPNIGYIKSYIKSLKNNTKNIDITIQRQAMLDFLGISPEALIKRSPRINKIEVFWFSSTGSHITALFKRTFEDDIPYFNNKFGFLAMMDIRPVNEIQTKFNILSNNDFWVTINQPQQFDKYIEKYPNKDIPGYFSKNNIAGTTMCSSTSTTTLSNIFPNIMKVFSNNLNGGDNLKLLFSNKDINKTQYSITCELNAPFLNFEINSDIPEIEETRNPLLFSSLIIKTGLQFRTHSEEKEYVPGRKSFVRLNNRNSSIIINNILFQAWRTMTCAIRIQTRATGNDAKDTIFSFVYGKYYLVVYATPEGSNSATLWVKTNITPNGFDNISKLNSKLEIGTWCLFTANNMGNGLSISCDPISYLINNNGYRSIFYFQSNIADYFTKYYNNSLSIITIGTKSIGNWNLEQWKGFYSTNALNYDIAWIHFFDTIVCENDIKRECMCNWIYTQYPQEYGVYKLPE